METSIFLDKLHQKLPNFNFMSVHKLGTKGDDLIVATSPTTNGLMAAFKFDGQLIYALTLGPSISIVELRHLLNTADELLEEFA